MSEPQADRDRPEPARPDVPRRVVADWEYRTSYIESYQVRLPAGLHDRLGRWAGRAKKPVAALLMEILEEAARRRTGGRAQGPGDDAPAG